MKLKRVEWDQAEFVWPKVHAWINEACLEEGGSYLAEDILEMVKSRALQMWIAEDSDMVHAVAITEIRAHPRRKTFWVWMMMGKHLEQWDEYRHVLAQWARMNGCKGKKAMKSLARRGYAKLFKEYQCTHVLLERDL